MPDRTVPPLSAADYVKLFQPADDIRKLKGKETCTCGSEIDTDEQFCIQCIDGETDYD